MPPPDADGMTVWSIFPRKSDYFGPSGTPYMVNYVVDDLDGLLEALKAAGIETEPKQESEYGKFAWLFDPEGNKIELWEAPK